MKKIVLFFFVLVLAFECFSQASATASVSATIIDASELLREAGYNTPSKLTPADKMYIIDSMLSVQVKIKTKILLSKRTARMQAENATYTSAIGQPHSFKAAPPTKEQEWYGQVHLSVWEDACQMIRFHNKTPQKGKQRKLKTSFFWCN